MIRRYILADQARVHTRPAADNPHEIRRLIEIPDDDHGIVVEWHCDVAIACNGGPRPRIEHNVDLAVSGPGYPATRVSFCACEACCRLIAPNNVRLLLASYGIDLPPGLKPDS